MANTQERTAGSHVGAWRSLALGSTVVAISLNQRPALVAVGPLTPQLRADTGLGATAVSVLTTLPLLCFGVFALAAPVAGRRWGIDRTLTGALIILLAGIGLRMLPSVPALFVGSAVAGIGIAVSNVLLPSLIKRDYPLRTGPMMGLYSLCLNGGAALAAAGTVPFGSALSLNWRVTLGAWGLMTLVALALWLPRICTAGHRQISAPVTRLPVWRSKLAWAVSLFMALQSLVYYALIAWLPTLLTDAGLSQSRAGLTASIMSIAGTASSLLIPIFATRSTNQRVFVGVSVLGFLFGLIGLLLAPNGAPVLWVILLGIGQGAGIGLALTLFVLRTQSASAAADLSGMAQTIGYLIAAAGPLLAGALHDLTDSWSATILALTLALAALLATGWIAAANRVVEDELHD
ncbi:CynX/NimT family MFS transporter [Mycolicibacterium komossense]|uniref:MFS transporter n=1 Tax=Mycolicibacterium komossense TaxID=1779 RepID=A0ABT3CC43_9MYCO|nr:MFS transporter [Mycolicibacterium komossense]MCV7226953.1 MFS transporter [Mycolicibacterium komossense]